MGKIYNVNGILGLVHAPVPQKSHSLRRAQTLQQSNFIFNLALGQLGIIQMDFLRSTTQALPAVLMPAIWAGLGFQIIIFMAGLRSIPESYYEAAKIDGAGGWQILNEITIPQLRSTIIFIVITSSIGFLRIFDQVYNMTQ